VSASTASTRSGGTRFQPEIAGPMLARNEGVLATGRDDVTEAIVADRLSEPDCAGGFLLDGFPRTIHQVEALDRILGADGLTAVLSLEADIEPLVARILKRAEIENRPDDNETTVRHRMEVYACTTAPLLAHYRAAGLLVEVNGDGSVDEVTDRIAAALETVKV